MMKAMVDYRIYPRRIKIFSIEGNENASSYFKKIVDDFNRQYNTSIELHQENLIFSPENFKQQLSDYLNKKSLEFDFITSSKFVGEFYNQYGGKEIKLFKGLTEVISKFLKPDGIYLLLDVVAGSRDRQCKFKTMIMSDELNEYVNTQENSLKYILPSPCARWSSICKTKGCYYEQCFKVTHSQCENEESNVAFRAMAHKDFANQIFPERKRKDNYKISRRTQCKNGVVSSIN